MVHARGVHVRVRTPPQRRGSASRDFTDAHGRLTPPIGRLVVGCRSWGRGRQDLRCLIDIRYRTSFVITVALWSERLQWRHITGSQATVPSRAQVWLPAALGVPRGAPLLVRYTAVQKNGCSGVYLGQTTLLSMLCSNFLAPPGTPGTCRSKSMILNLAGTVGGAFPRSPAGAQGLAWMAAWDFPGNTFRAPALPPHCGHPRRLLKRTIIGPGTNVPRPVYILPLLHILQVLYCTGRLSGLKFWLRLCIIGYGLTRWAWISVTAVFPRLLMCSVSALCLIFTSLISLGPMTVLH